MPRKLSILLVLLALPLAFAVSFSAARSLLQAPASNPPAESVPAITSQPQVLAKSPQPDRQNRQRVLDVEFPTPGGSLLVRSEVPVRNDLTPPQASDLSVGGNHAPVSHAAPVIALPGTLVYTVKQRSESITLLARHFLAQTSYMTVPELEAAIRRANLDKKGNYFKKGDQVIIPGYEAMPFLEKPLAKSADSDVRAIYLTGYTAGSIKGIALIRHWKELGGNAVVFDVKDFDGLVNVPFENPLAPTRRPPISNLPKFVRFLHTLRLHAIARIALFLDAYQAQNHPQLIVRSRRSGGPWTENGKLAWVDPSNAEAQDYNLALARTAAQSGVDEIQFDYVRFPAEGDQADAQFYFQSRAFRAKHPDWQRKDVIVDFLTRAYSELHSLGVLVSLDVFGVMAWQRKVDLDHTGQDVAEMAKHCDVLSPMIYPSHFFHMDGFERPGEAPAHFINESMSRFRKITADTHVAIRPWLQAFGWRTPSYSPAYVHTQVLVARENGGVGYLLWNARNDYSKVFPAMPESGMLPRPQSTAQTASPKPQLAAPAVTLTAPAAGRR